MREVKIKSQACKKDLKKIDCFLTIACPLKFLWIRNASVWQVELFFEVSPFLEFLGTNEVFLFGLDFKQLHDDLQHHNVLHYGRIYSFFLANLLQKFIPLGLGCMWESYHLIFQNYAALICQLFFFVFQFWIWIFSTGFALEKKL